MDSNVESDNVEGQPLSLATLADFAAVDLDAVLQTISDADDHQLLEALRTEEAAARAAEDAERGRVFAVLAGLMSCHLRNDNPAQPFGPMLILDDRRTMIPSDIRGEQTAVLAAVVDRMSHPSLRARVGDIAFLNSRVHYVAGRSAMEAYCERVLGRLAGAFPCTIPGMTFHLNDVVAPLRRAIALMGLLQKRGQPAECVRTAFERAFAAAQASGSYVAFVDLADLGLAAGLLSPDDVAGDAERLAKAAPPGTYPEALKRVWLMAARCHAYLGRDDDDNRCRVEAAEQTLKMREPCQGSLAHAHWVKAAIGELRQAKGTGERVRALTLELRELQMAAQGELIPYVIPLDVTDERQAAGELFERLDLPEAFLTLITFVQPPNMDELYALVAEQEGRSVIGSLMGGSYLDTAGKEVARTQPTGVDSPSGPKLKAACVQHMSFVRLQQVQGVIEPARMTLAQRFSIEERHLAPIVQATPFCPPGHDHLFALGFARMFQGDYVTAAHILFPQLENSLRHLLGLAGVDTAKIDGDLLEGDRSLSAVLDVNRADLERMWGRDVVHEIDILFNCRPGPSLRNELAHGKLSWNALHSPDAIAGCWFMFHLACRPILRRWRESIAPEIANQA